MFRTKIGFVFSGAGARIAQECALTEALIEGLIPSRREIRPDVVAGASAGALNAVAVNAILKTKDGKAGNDQAFGWEDYKKILFALESGDVFDVTARGLARIVPRNVPEGFVLDTTPLRKLLEEAVQEKAGFETLGDLYLSTYISVVGRDTGKILRLSSRDPDPRIRKLPLVDVLMASAAIPGAFKPRKIEGLEGEFIDGGVGRDGIPVEAMSGERCKELYIISRMRGGIGTGLGIPKVLKKPPKILETSLLAFQFFTDALFRNEIERAPTIASRAFLYVPQLPKNYSMLDFSTQREQYEETMHWAKQHDPVRLK
ncbi:patatin-like phospholipase family protein [candidate division WOR-3 bacterium]|nr:patatin-like phospholipase family protein [candidate division WOR-3 bacterium]